MTLRTYQAPTMAECLTKVKKDLGKDAVILHTRSFKKGSWFGLLGRQQVEITASVDVNVRPVRERRPTVGAGGGSAGGASSGAAAIMQPAGRSAGQTTAHWAAPDSTRRGATSAGQAAVTGGSLLQRVYGTRPTQPAASALRPVRADEPMNSPAPEAGAAVARANQSASAGMSTDLREELSAIKVLLGQMLQTAALGAAAGPGPRVAAAMPEALLSMYLRLIQQDVGREIADRIIADIRDELTPQELADTEIVRLSVLRHIESLITADNALTPPVRQPDGRPQTIALVGPTGVGKTTTVAKLAASYRLRHGRKVGLITADTYRIAAVDQLRTYSSIIGVPLRVAMNPEEMTAAIESMADLDVILIDTAGRSPSDDQRIDELAAMLDAARPHQTHLVLASVASEAALVRTLTRFAPMNPTRLIFTKLDESASFGVLINILRRTTAKLSFVTTGQEVPDDIEPGRPERLARLVLDGPTAKAVLNSGETRA